MATDPKASTYSAMVAEAEQAVAAVKDPELRRAAFEKILATLLEGGSPNSRPSRARIKVNPPKGRSAARTKPPKGNPRRGPKGHVEELIDDGFFKNQQTIAQVKAELANRGHHIALTSLSGPLQQLTRAKRLRRQKVAANKKGRKTTYAYSNW
jgi:hypothetical protein